MIISGDEEELFTKSPSSSSRPLKRPQGRVVGLRMGQYRDETSSSEDDDDVVDLDVVGVPDRPLSLSPSSVEDETFFGALRSTR